MVVVFFVADFLYDLREIICCFGLCIGFFLENSRKQF